MSVHIAPPVEGDERWSSAALPGRVKAKDVRHAPLCGASSSAARHRICTGEIAPNRGKSASELRLYIRCCGGYSCYRGKKIIAALRTARAALGPCHGA
jgi:hypothetical protein